MQWSRGHNGGFSDADPADLAAPVVEGELGPERVNVADQRRDPGSLLNWVRLLVRRYRECPELSWGNCRVLEHDAPAVLAHRSDHEQGTIIAVHNFSDEKVDFIVPVGRDIGDRLVDLLDDGAADVADDGTARLALDRYGCRWLRALRPGDRHLV